MDEAKKMTAGVILDGLGRIEEQWRGWGEAEVAKHAASLIRKLQDDIQRHAAEVERMRPREMSLEEACEVLSKHHYRKSNWYTRVNASGDKVASAQSLFLSLYEPEAVAVAEKLLREKEAR